MKEKTKNILIGILIGMIIGGGIAWASVQQIILVDNNEATFGTTANPLYITTP